MEHGVDNGLFPCLEGKNLLFCTLHTKGVWGGWKHKGDGYTEGGRYTQI